LDWYTTSAQSQAPRLTQPEPALSAGWNEHLAKAGDVNRHIAWHISPCPWSRSVLWMPGWWLASGDQRRLTGSGSALETFVTMRYTNGRVYSNLLLFHFTATFVWTIVYLCCTIKSQWPI